MERQPIIIHVTDAHTAGKKTGPRLLYFAPCSPLGTPASDTLRVHKRNGFLLSHCCYARRDQARSPGPDRCSSYSRLHGGAPAGLLLTPRLVQARRRLKASHRTFAWRAAGLRRRADLEQRLQARRLH